VRKQAAFLDYIADAAPQPEPVLICDSPTSEKNLACRRFQQAVHHPEQGCLSGAASTQQDYRFVLLDTEVDSTQYVAIPDPISDIPELDQSRHSGEIQFHLVDKTPTPVLSALERAHDRMFGFMKVFGRVFIL
jgi:hypothetical protein